MMCEVESYQPSSLCLRYVKVGAGSGLVKMSASWSFVGTYSMVIIPSDFLHDHDESFGFHKSMVLNLGKDVNSLLVLWFHHPALFVVYRNRQGTLSLNRCFMNNWELNPLIMSWNYRLLINKNIDDNLMSFVIFKMKLTFILAFISRDDFDDFD